MGAGVGEIMGAGVGEIMGAGVGEIMGANIRSLDMSIPFTASFRDAMVGSGTSAFHRSIHASLAALPSSLIPINTLKSLPWIRSGFVICNAFSTSSCIKNIIIPLVIFKVETTNVYGTGDEGEYIVVNVNVSYRSDARHGPV